MRIWRAHIETPLGPMLGMATGEGLCALEFHRGERLTRLDRRLGRWFSPYSFDEGPNAIIENARAWLRAYFSGTSAAISGLPLDLRGAPFELRVWAALREIPAGATRSYGDIATQLGDSGAARAVGTSNGANPVAIVVPCHRVIGADGSLTGYGGGLDKKIWLLDHERRWRADTLF